METNQSSNTPKLKLTREDFMVDGVVVPEETEDSILGLFGKYRPLSNFHDAAVTVAGRTYRCSEAAYMAEKTDNYTEKNILTNCRGKEAKSYGQSVTLKPNWDEFKIFAMQKVIRCKFYQNAELTELLLSTGNKTIVESNWWGDKFWGVCGGEGRNWLGIILMHTRDELRAAAGLGTPFKGL